jgi:hypothetical protein
VAGNHDSVWVLCPGYDHQEGPALESRLSQASGAWRCVPRRPFVLWCHDPKSANQQCRYYHLVKTQSGGMRESLGRAAGAREDSPIRAR